MIILVTTEKEAKIIDTVIECLVTAAITAAGVIAVKFVNGRIQKRNAKINREYAAEVEKAINKGLKIVEDHK